MAAAVTFVNFDAMFWKMWTKSMEPFFKNINPKEINILLLTEEELREIEELKISVVNLHHQAKLGIAKIKEIKETSKKVKEFEAEISTSENCEFEVTVMKPIQVKKSVRCLTNCQQCSFTCHSDCALGNNEGKHRCVAMDELNVSNRHCKMCAGKCHWKVHVDQDHRWEYEEQTEKRTVEELMKKYNIVNENKSPVEALLGELKAEYDAVLKEVEALLKRSAAGLNQLEIFFKPNLPSRTDWVGLEWILHSNIKIIRY